MSFRSLADHLNFAGAESTEDVAAGVLSFSKDGDGHGMATACVNELRNHFRGYDWGYNGPGVITRTLVRWCGTDKVSRSIYFRQFIRTFEIANLIFVLV